jgi:subtilisin-like proprotein convertase family protein
MNISKSKFALIVFLLLCTTLAQSQITWKKESVNIAATIQAPRIPNPVAYNAYKIDYDVTKKELLSAASLRGDKTISLPLPDGSMISFEYKEAQLMEQGLKDKYPNIRAYEGTSVDGNYAVKFDIGSFGLHACILSSKGEIYITPASGTDPSIHYVYYGKDLIDYEKTKFSCGVHEKSEEQRITKQEVASLRAGEIPLQTYRFAVATTGEWGAVRVTKEAALSDLVSSTNRLNQIFEKDLGIRLILIANNDLLIHLNADTDPYSGANMGGSLLTQNTSIMNNLVGAFSYDLGHVYTNRCTDVGGVAYLRSICAGNKGGGVSCFYSGLITITNQVVAHEIGHQLGANHTFHSCGENVSLGNDFEPGSGSTIMAYGGLCGTDNVASANDTYFHQASLSEIYDNIRRLGTPAFNCAIKVPTSNITPVITNMPRKEIIIPTSTPFILSGTAKDANGDVLLYNWEQKDSTFSSTKLGSPSGNAPLFRSFPPRIDSFRLFPSPAFLFSNVNINTEVLPSYSRSMNFVFTARDNNTQVGTATWSTMNMRVVDIGGPFSITSGNSPFEIEAGAPFKLTWNVAATNKFPFNATKVNIYISTDQALNLGNPKFKLIASNVANDGEETVYMPEIISSNSRFVVRPIDNVFFDISNSNIRIVPASKPIAYFEYIAPSTDLCLPATSKIDLVSSGIGGYNGNINYKITNLPSGVKATFSKTLVKVGENVELTFDISNDVPTGDFDFTIIGSGTNNDSIVRTLRYNVISNNFNDLATLLPLNGSKNLGGLPEFTWSGSQNAVNYTFQISTDPTFASNNLFFSGDTDTKSYKPSKTLDKAKIYFWRVRANNTCGNGAFTQAKAIGTEVLACKTFSSSDLPINISSSGRPTIESKINVGEDFNITDCNIKPVSVEHDFFKDLTATLISPKGTQVVIWENQCPRRMVFTSGFDDEAPSIFTCSTLADAQWKPVGMLSAFKDENAKGQWTFKIEDKVAGSGGRLSGLTLEFCGNIPVDNPKITRNALIKVPYKTSVTVKNTTLQSIDSTSSAKDLTYVVINPTVFGNIELSGKILKVGDTFTQLDIDTDKVKYTNIGPATLANNTGVRDRMAFVVKDPDGGWEGIATLEISVENGTVVSTNELENEISLQVYPNPTSGMLIIDTPQDFGNKGTLQVSDILGKTLINKEWSKDMNSLNIQSLENGMYHIVLRNGEKRYINRVLLVK